MKFYDKYRTQSAMLFNVGNKKRIGFFHGCWPGVQIYTTLKGEHIRLEIIGGKQAEVSSDCWETINRADGIQRINKTTGKIYFTPYARI